MRKRNPKEEAKIIEPYIKEAVRGFQHYVATFMLPRHEKEKLTIDPTALMIISAISCLEESIRDTFAVTETKDKLAKKSIQEIVLAGTNNIYKQLGLEIITVRKP